MVGNSLIINLVTTLRVPCHPDLTSLPHPAWQCRPDAPRPVPPGVTGLPVASLTHQQPTHDSSGLVTQSVWTAFQRGV